MVPPRTGKKGKGNETHSYPNPNFLDYLGADRHKRLAPLVRRTVAPAKAGVIALLI